MLRICYEYFWRFVHDNDRRLTEKHDSIGFFFVGLLRVIGGSQVIEATFFCDNFGANWSLKTIACPSQLAEHGPAGDFRSQEYKVWRKSEGRDFPKRGLTAILSVYIFQIRPFFMTFLG